MPLDPAYRANGIAPLPGPSSLPTANGSIASVDANGVFGGWNPATMPDDALGIWYFDRYRTTPRPQVPNSRSTANPIANLLVGPRRVFSNAAFWNAGADAVDSGLPGPGNTNDASTYTKTADYFLAPTVNLTLAAGTYTIALWAKRNTGSDQQFQMGCFTGSLFSSTFTATASWQRFTFTFTATAGSKVITPLISFDRATGVNLQILDVEMFAGSGDLGSGTPATHLVIAKDPGVPPSYANGAMDFSAAGYGLIQLPSGGSSFYEHTAIALVSKVSAGGSHQAYFSKVQDWGNFSPCMEQSGKQQALFGAVSVVGLGEGLWNLLNDNFHVITCRSNSTSINVFLDDVLIATKAVTPTTPVEAADLFVARLLTITTTYRIAALALYDRSLSNADVRRAVAVFHARAAANSLTVPALRIYAAEGNSITATSTAYPYLFGPNANPRVYGWNHAVSGTGLADALLRAPAVDAMIPPNPGTRKFIFSSAIGGPDVVGLSDYLDARRAAGWKVIATTFLPRTTAGWNTTRNASNVTIRSWVGTHCDYLCDFAADPTMGPDAAASNVSLYSDGIHPTAAGQVILETVIRPVINSI